MPCKALTILLALTVLLLAAIPATTAPGRSTARAPSSCREASSPLNQGHLRTGRLLPVDREGVKHRANRPAIRWPSWTPGAVHLIGSRYAKHPLSRCSQGYQRPKGGKTNGEVCMIRLWME